HLPNANGSFTDLIPTLCAQGYLDILVQDDSAVDFVVLEVQSCRCRDDVVVTAAAGACGANVQFGLPQFTDNCDRSLQVTCDPPSGSFFPVGSTAVKCS